MTRRRKAGTVALVLIGAYTARFAVVFARTYRKETKRLADSLERW